MWVKIGRSLLNFDDVNSIEQVDNEIRFQHNEGEEFECEYTSANEAENTFDKIVEIISKTTVVLDLGGGEVI